MELVGRACELADGTLFGSAQELDAAGLAGQFGEGPAGAEAKALLARNLSLLAQAGMMSPRASERHLPSKDPSGAASVHEALASGCGATSFVWAQHASPMRRIAASANEALRQRWLGPMSSGEALGGIAFSHLRRPGAGPLRARHHRGRWVLEGKAPWVTSWGLASLFVVGARSGEGEVAWFVLDPHDEHHRRGLRPEPVALSVLGASATVSLEISWEGSEEDLIALEAAQEWEEEDRLATAIPSAGASGIVRRCLAMLADAVAGSPAGDLGVLEELAGRISEMHYRVRERSYALLAQGEAAGGRIAQLAALRARGLVLAQQAAAAVVAVSGGRAMSLSHPAQRLAREAAFYSIQAQSLASRRETLVALLADLEGPEPPGP